MNRSAGRVAPFYAVEINRLANERERRGLPVIHMEVGQPSAGAPPAALEAGSRAIVECPQGYWESSALAERLARHYREAYGLELPPERIVLTMGASAALVLAMSVLFSPGARVAMARPGYPAHRNSLLALGLEPVEIDCDAATRFQPTAAMVAALDPAPAGLILTSPSNPTGTMIEDAGLAEIAAVCAERGIRIVSDETYHGITYGNRAHSILEHAPEAVVANTFSKYWCMTGWRLGWAVVPPGLVEPMRRFANNLFLVPPTISQHVALAAMDEVAALEANVATYAGNRRLLTEALAGLGITRIAPPDGAFYLYADVGELTRDSLAWCQELLDATGVAINTGRDFDAVHGDRFVRISFAVSAEETLGAIERIDGWVRRRRRA
ncbi:MAG TPA: aminotransferase class I/II-fold pyridoxal phosphate-dependent enzyme [Steroidobacteraceae bacterium]|nr:aminotransferase class I/II-fold pyridoxal phosphate-dependent enzyme [Steroidobacteraceae bacterium]